MNDSEAKICCFTLFPLYHFQFPPPSQKYQNRKRFQIKPTLLSLTTIYNKWRCLITVQTNYFNISFPLQYNIDELNCYFKCHNSPPPLEALQLTCLFGDVSLCVSEFNSWSLFTRRSEECGPVFFPNEECKILNWSELDNVVPCF